ncbi:MAG: tyrosine-type recombinase/integrase [Planctomycetota bacterium]|nr:tyrosine-type recombinase/integrase [Planctomycetota bacterium]
MKVRKLVVTETDADGKRIKRPSTKFYGVFVDWSGGLRRLPLLENRRASEVLARTVDRLNNVRAGGDVLTPDLAEAVEKMPPSILARLGEWGILSGMRLAAGKGLAEHVADWKAALLAKGGTDRYAELVTSRAGKAFAACGFKQWGDISASRLQGHLAGLRTDRRKADGSIERGLSAQTFNFYLQAVKQFSRWMVQDGRATESALAHLRGLNVRTDRRHDRRALSADELRWLLDTTEHGPERFGMSGPARAMLYGLAVGSGLRAGELRSLTRSSFRLEGAEPAVVVAAAYSKHRRQDVQPIRPDLAALLKTHLAGKMPNALAFNVPGRTDVSRMFQADLADARRAWLQSRRMPASTPRTAQDASEGEGDTFLAYIDAAGRYADFHSLRHSFITALVMGGVNPKEAQSLARHSVITLTMDRYTHQYAGNLTAALSVLPDLSSPNSQTARATGTDGRLAGGNPSCQNPVFPVSPPVSLEGAVSSSLVESCGVDKQMSASAESPGKTGRNRAFTGVNEAAGKGRIDPPFDGIEHR